MLKVDYLYFGSLESAYYVRKIIFEIKDNEDKTNIYTPMLAGSVKNMPPFISMAEIASPKNSGVGFGDRLVIFPSHIRARQ